MCMVRILSDHALLYVYGLYPYQQWIVVCVWFVSFPTMNRCMGMFRPLSNHEALYVARLSTVARLRRLHVSRYKLIRFQLIPLKILIVQY